MPIKKDETGKRWVEMEILVPGTPEQVWEAIATGPGYAGWFVKTELEPRVGGKVVFDFGGGATSGGEVTRWEPPHHVAYVERDWEKGAPPVATEITVAARSGDRCVMRMVHSLFTSSDAWDDQVEGFENGWISFFAVLKVYLARFAGQRAGSFMAVNESAQASLATWQRLVESVGLAGASVGERRTTPAGAPDSWSGVVEQVHQDARQRFIVVRVEEPSPGIVVVGTHDKGSTSHPAAGETPSSAGVCRYFYGPDSEARAAESEQRWRSFLAGTFGAKSG